MGEARVWVTLVVCGDGDWCDGWNLVGEGVFVNM
jgi:hypothetical protein